MPAKRNDEKADAMAALYAQGYSLSQVAVAFSMSRQGAYKILKLRCVPLRTVEPLRFIVWNERKFTIDHHGYYRETSGPRKHLHRLVWSQANGRIPKGYDVHHKDGNQQNNKLSNLELLTESDHGKAHGFAGNQYVPSKGKRPVK